VVEMERNQMQLGYTPRWELPPHRRLVLGTKCTSKDEAIRKAAYEA
jgi:hypothetical protein